jgi:hypothetical protein
MHIPWHFMGFAFLSDVWCDFTILLRTLPFGASFLQKHFHLCFRNFLLSPLLCRASFFPEHFCLRFRDFYLAPCSVGLRSPQNAFVYTSVIFTWPLALHGFVPSGTLSFLLP